MSKFLTTSGNSYYIEQIVINSKKYLVLITPYLQLSRNFVDRLLDAEKRGVKITLIFGKNELAKKQQDILYSLNNIEIFFCENLHAKCYHNEESMIITSMNLYEFSEKNNREMGLLIKHDNEIFADAIREIESIKNSSELVKVFRKSNQNSKNIVKMDKSYKEIWNFHFPSLYNVLKEKYPNHKITFEGEEINMYDFPFSGIDICINYRIDVKISNNVIYNRIKKKFKNIFDKLPDRYYWNHNLCIYEEKSFSVEANESGLLKKVKKYVDIIESLYNNIQPNENKIKFRIMMC